MLHRFVPFGTREPDLDLEEVHPRGPIARGMLAVAAAATAGAAIVAGIVFSALLDAAKAARGPAGKAFDFPGALGRLIAPTTPGEWLALLGPLVFGLLCGFAVAGLLAARRGIRRSSPAP